jgi:hypothetical protein
MQILAAAVTHFGWSALIGGYSLRHLTGLRRPGVTNSTVRLETT